MNAEGKFWVSIWAMFFAAVTVVLTSLILNDFYATRRMAEMIAHGADPVAARCGVFGGDTNGHIDCNLLHH